MDADTVRPSTSRCRKIPRTPPNSMTQRYHTPRSRPLIASLALSALGASLGGSGHLHAAPVTAISADGFVDSFGTNVHWIQSSYLQNYTTLEARLSDLGIRHVRDGASVGTGPNNAAFTPATNLYNHLGVDTNWITGWRTGGYPAPLDPTKVGQEISTVKANVPLGSIGAFEGPNEYDLSHDSRETNWAGTLDTYQQNLFSTVNGDSQLAAKPVLAPSLTSAGAYTSAGNLDSSIDSAVLHLYQSSRPPGTAGWGSNGYGSITYALNYCAYVQSPAHKPVWATECGYAYSGTDFITEAVAAKYIPRMLAEFAVRGVQRTYNYELCSDQWGLLRGDLSTRPSFLAVKNLLNLLNDNSWDTTNKRWTQPSFTAGSLDYALSGTTANVHQLLLEKRNGVFYLALWQEVYDPAYWTETWQPKYTADAAVTLTVNTSAQAGVSIYTLNGDGTMTTTAGTLNASHQVALSIPDRITVVAITPAQIFETESLTVPASSGDTHRVITGTGFSGGSGTILDADAVGDYVTYLVPNVAAATYDVRIGVKKFTGRGIWQLAIGRADNFSGTKSNVGSPVDEYTTAETYTEVDLGLWAPASTSDKWFQFAITGKNASSAGYGEAFDYIKLIKQ